MMLSGHRGGDLVAPRRWRDRDEDIERRTTACLPSRVVSDDVRSGYLLRTPPFMTDGALRMAKRLSMAHCHAPVRPVRCELRPAGPLPLHPATEHRILHLRQGLWCIDRQQLAAPASVILRAGQMLTVECEGDAAIATVRFTARLAGGVDALAPCSGTLSTTHAPDSELIPAWDAVLRVAESCRNGDVWARPRLRGAVTTVVALTLQDGFTRDGWRWEDPQQPTWLSAVLTHIDAQLGRSELDVAALADVAQMSASRFAHAFRGLLGVPPMRHVLEQRMQRALALMEDPALPIKTIAHACGFRDPEQFTASFRKRTGRTPSAWREQKNRGG